MTLLINLEVRATMSEKSHVDVSKLNNVPNGHPFEYKDVVKESFVEENHTEDGKRFKSEVKNGEYDGVIIDKDTGSHLLYRKL
jgi:hypothetical protein